MIILLFLALKLTGTVDWSWWWILLAAALEHANGKSTERRVTIARPVVDPKISGLAEELRKAAARASRSVR